MEQGRLVTSKYGPDTPVLDFCVDLLLGSGERIAVTCDLCKGKKVKGGARVALLTGLC